jgi:hypothetical protein
MRLRIGVTQRAQRLLAEDDAEAEGSVGRVPFPDAHLDRSIVA